MRTKFGIMFTNTVIEATGSYIPKTKIPNDFFLNYKFMDKEGQSITKPTSDIVQKLEEITQIEERRYENQLNTYEMAAHASEKAFENSRISKEELGGIIVAHNFGDVKSEELQGHMIPNLAAKVKNALGIRNSKCFAFDVLFGCPGWLLALDQAHQYIQNGVVKSILVVGVESLSRMVDPNDIDAMLFGDGAGAAIVVAEESEKRRGVLSYNSHSDCGEELEYLKMDKPRNGVGNDLRISMTGRSVFKYAVSTLPEVITEGITTAGLTFDEIDTFVFHQANGKMLDVIGSKLAEKNGAGCIRSKVPLTLNKLGNTSVATIPTLLDLINDGEIDSFSYEKDKKIVMASVGAGMHANCLVYHY